MYKYRYESNDPPNLIGESGDRPGPSGYGAIIAPLRRCPTYAECLTTTTYLRTNSKLVETECANIRAIEIAQFHGVDVPVEVMAGDSLATSY
jgi:hypothetical protein